MEDDQTGDWSSHSVSFRGHSGGIALWDSVKAVALADTRDPDSAGGRSVVPGSYGEG